MSDKRSANFDPIAPTNPLEPRLSRREFVGAGAVAVGTLAVGWRAVAEEPKFSLPESTLGALKESPFVYVSPLKSTGGESRCHGEVWYFEDGGDAVLATATDTWKAQALSKGLNRARVWVGDYGRVKQAGDKFRAGPSFIAQATRDTDAATFERLMKTFAGSTPTSGASGSRDSRRATTTRAEF